VEIITFCAERPYCAQLIDMKLFNIVQICEPLKPGRHWDSTGTTGTDRDGTGTAQALTGTGPTGAAPGRHQDSTGTDWDGTRTDRGGKIITVSL
jgi:hypothetical protein